MGGAERNGHGLLSHCNETGTAALSKLGQGRQKSRVGRIGSYGQLAQEGEVHTRPRDEGRPSAAPAPPPACFALDRIPSHLLLPGASLLIARMSSANVFAQVLRRASVGLHRLGALEAAPGSSRSSSGSRLGTCSPHFGCSTRAYSDGGRRSVSHGSQGLELPGRDLVDQDPLWEAVAQELAALSVERRVLEARLQEMSLEVGRLVVEECGHDRLTLSLFLQSSSSETMPVAVESAAGVSLLWNEAPAPAEELTPKRPEPPVAYEPLAALAGAGQRQIIIICDYGAPSCRLQADPFEVVR